MPEGTTTKSVKRSGARALAIAAMIGALPAFAATTASADEITVTIERVAGRGPADIWSRSDFFARVTIDGVTTTTDVVRNQNDARPNWVITKNVRRGVRDVRIEILDRDMSKQERIDITRTTAKKDLEFRVDTTRCRVLGFAQGYRCGDSITREGNEGKSAEITFKVEAKR